MRILWELVQRWSCYNPKIICFWRRGREKISVKNNAKNILFLWQNMMFFPARMQYASIEETPQNIYVWNQNIPVSFHPENKTLKNEKKKKWHALCQCSTQLSGRTSYIHTGHSVSVQRLWVTLCTMKRESVRAGLCVCVCVRVHGSMSVCARVWMPQIKDEACQK